MKQEQRRECKESSKCDEKVNQFCLKKAKKESIVLLKKLLGAKGIATRSKDATRNKKLLSCSFASSPPRRFQRFFKEASAVPTFQ